MKVRYPRARYNFHGHHTDLITLLFAEKKKTGRKKASAIQCRRPRKAMANWIFQLTFFPLSQEEFFVRQFISVKRPVTVKIELSAKLSRY